MRVAWICNLILPEIAGQLGLSSIPKEGWVSGMLTAVLGEQGKNGEFDISPILIFPVPEANRGCKGEAELTAVPGSRVEYYGFVEDTVHPEIYDESLENQLHEIFAAAKPDIVHCFGTEYPHTLAAAKVWNRPNRLLIGIQGPISQYAEVYYAHLPERVRNSRTFRDRLKKDSIREQQRKYCLRGKNELAAAALCGHIAGRTDFDRELAMKWNPNAVYHHGGETLRSVFYQHENAWDETQAEENRIFVSQADYPIKGFHYVLEAAHLLGAGRKPYGRSGQKASAGENSFADLQIYVAGQSLVSCETLKDRIKRSAYGRYLRRLMKQYGLENNVHFEGRLSAEEMCEQYLKCSAYVCASESENSPNSLGEAMLLGVPCVAAAVGGIPTMLPETAGYLYPSTQEMSAEEIIRGLAEALAKALNEKEARKERTAEAVARARRNHNPAGNAQELLEIYKGMTQCD